MSERVTWADCPLCGEPAAVGWETVMGRNGTAREEVVEFDCVDGCLMSDLQFIGRSAFQEEWRPLPNRA
jgi:hypothetical protein